MSMLSRAVGDISSWNEGRMRCLRKRGVAVDQKPSRDAARPDDLHIQVFFKEARGEGIREWFPLTALGPVHAGGGGTTLAKHINQDRMIKVHACAMKRKYMKSLLNLVYVF